MTSVIAQGSHRMQNRRQQPLHRIVSKLCDGPVRRPKVFLRRALILARNRSGVGLVAISRRHVGL